MPFASLKEMPGPMIKSYSVKRLSFLYLFAALSLPAFANVKESNKPCTDRSRIGAVCVAEIVTLKPTQFAVGMIEVREKAKELAAMSSRQLQKYMRDHTVPAVRGPAGRLYITDHHHFSRAARDLGAGSVYVKIIDDLSTLSEDRFWEAMVNDQRAYLYDENGQGPISPQQLPDDVDQMADDVYRSLAWAVEKEGAYADIGAPYGSFVWANYFRTQVPQTIASTDFPRAIQLGAIAARSPEARGLPGYRGP
jgi:hypothetical protein